MPIYEYQCTSCGHRLEAMQKMSDALLKDCPECRQSALRKLMSAAGVHVKNGASRTDMAPACGAGACGACEFAD